MKSLIIIFGAFLLIVVTPFVFTALDDAVSDEYTQTFAGVTTDAAIYAANVTLTKTALNDSETDIIAVSSNESRDAPSASYYNSVSQALEVSGLNDDEERTLSVTYLSASSSLPAGYGSFFTNILRWFWVLTILGTCGGAVYAFFAD